MEYVGHTDEEEVVVGVVVVAVDVMTSARWTEERLLLVGSTSVVTDDKGPEGDDFIVVDPS